MLSEKRIPALLTLSISLMSCSRVDIKITDGGHKNTASRLQIFDTNIVPGTILTGNFSAPSDLGKGRGTQQIPGADTSDHRRILSGADV
jgi:hypothetical protein